MKHTRKKENVNKLYKTENGKRLCMFPEKDPIIVSLVEITMIAC